MGPKKDAKKDKGGKKDELSAEDKADLERQMLEAEKFNLAVELAFQKDRLKQSKEIEEQLESEVAEVRSKLQKDDILTHKQLLIDQKVERVNALDARLKELDALIMQRDERIQVLEREKKESVKKLDEVAAMQSEKMMLEETVRRQTEAIKQLEEEMAKNKEEVGDLEGRLADSNLLNEELGLKCSGSTELKIIFQEPWMVKRSFHKLRNEVPPDREDNTLNVMGGKLLVLFGGAARGDSMGKDLHVANVDGIHDRGLLQWDRVSGGGKQAMGRAGHTATAASKNKLVIFGGRRVGQGQANLTGDVNVLNTDSMKWSTPAIKGSCPPREFHSATTVREKIYIFGGNSGNLANDLFTFDFDTQSWNQAVTSGMPPTARRGHTLCQTEDGRNLWLFGGYDGTKYLNDLYILETERMEWIPPGGEKRPPPAREGHVATLIGKYLLVSGGTDGVRRLTDTWVLNTEAMEWECIDVGDVGVVEAYLKQKSCYSVFNGNKLITLKPNREEQLEDMEVLEFHSPEHIEGLRDRKVEDIGSDRLELMEQASTAPNSIEVCWRPPLKNSDRINRYKLMMATNTGVVKEVCQGKYERFKVTGLRPNAQYIFCVKAIYDDGSFLWSESKSFRTR